MSIIRSRAISFKKNMNSDNAYTTSKDRNRKRQWICIIALAVIAHLAFFLFFKPQYLRIFYKEIGGDEGYTTYPVMDRPFSFVPYPEPIQPPVLNERAQKSEQTKEEQTTLDDLLGDPVTELLLMDTGKTGGSEGRPGPRRTTVEPKPLFIPWPKYPAGIKETIEGKVELLVLVNKKGEVEHVKIARGLPFDILNTTAVDAARNIRFTPGLEQGVPTAMWVRLTIGFQPR
jgi:TonB family protein